MLRRATIALFFLATWVHSAHAQARGPAFAPAAFARWAPVAPRTDLAPLRAQVARDTRRTHWVRGGLIGAGIGAVAIGLVVAVACSTGEGGDCTGDTVLGAGLGAGLGFIVGALVGGAFSSDEPASSAP